jgi:hemolysin activation/secretion protein
MLGYTSAVCSQDFSLEINSNKAAENIFLSKINYETKHSDSTALYIELNRVQKHLKMNGYFLSRIDSVSKEGEKYIAYLNLDKKIDSVLLKHKSIDNQILQKYNFKNNYIKIPINQLEEILNEISTFQELKGNAFSKIKLKKLRIDHKTLYAEIDLTTSKKRKIDKIILKGYDNFPESFIKNYLNINSKTTFNKKKLIEISKLSKGLDFVSETKPPEILFKKDSTLIYVYLKKIQGSSFDGLVNFNSQENGKLQFNGYLDLKLKNILNKGEQLNLLWNSFGNEKQEFSISVKTPYIYKSKLSPEFTFSIYKQDSTFLNTNLNANLKYQIKNNANLFLSFDSENSENNTKISSNNISTYENYFLGFGYEYKILKNDIFKNDIFFININPSFGKRKTTNNTSQQIKIETTLAYLLDLNRKNSIYFRNQTALLNSTNYFDNELFRIGGNKSIRGFNEQSIFVKNYLLQNIEFRYQTSKSSFMYTITDLALITTTNSKEKLYSFGLGYLFNSNSSQINISTAVGTNTKNPLDFKNTQFFVNWVNFF